MTNFASVARGALRLAVSESVSPSHHATSSSNPSSISASSPSTSPHVTGDMTRSPTASARALKMFIADSARHRARTKQLDFIGAFLQAKMRYRMFVTLPAKYGELFPEYKEWCGRPLLLLKSMYGTTYSGKMLVGRQEWWRIRTFYCRTMFISKRLR